MFEDQGVDLVGALDGGDVRGRRDDLVARGGNAVGDPLLIVAAGLGVSLVPASVSNMTVRGAVYRPLSDDTTRVELAAAWRRGDDRPVLARALDVIRRALHAG